MPRPGGRAETVVKDSQADLRTEPQAGQIMVRFANACSPRRLENVVSRSSVSDSGIVSRQSVGANYVSIMRWERFIVSRIHTDA